MSFHGKLCVSLLIQSIRNQVVLLRLNWFKTSFRYVFSLNWSCFSLPELMATCAQISFLRSPDVSCPFEGLSFMQNLVARATKRKKNTNIYIFIQIILLGLIFCIGATPKRSFDRHLCAVLCGSLL